LILDDGSYIEIKPNELPDSIVGACIFNIIYHPNNRKLMFITNKVSYSIEGVKYYVYRYDQR